MIAQLVISQVNDRIRHGKSSVRQSRAEEVGMGAATKPARLQDYTGYLLRRAYVKASGAVKECLPDDAHFREAATLAIIAERGAVSQRELSDLTHVNRTLIVKLVDGL